MTGDRDAADPSPDGAGRSPRQPERERVDEVLGAFHADVWPALARLAARGHAEGGEFADRLDAWAEAHGYGDLPLDERFDLAAKRCAYLLATRVLFHALRGEPLPEGLRGEGDATPDCDAGEDDDAPDGAAGDGPLPDPVGTLGARDDGALLAPATDLFGAFPLDAGTRRAAGDLRETLARRPLERVDGDLLGRVHGELAPADERAALGRVYTPPAVAEAAVRWTLPGDRGGAGSGEGYPDAGHHGGARDRPEPGAGPGDGPGPDGDDAVPRVLDPAAGSGVFTVAAYRVLADGYPGLAHREIASRLAAVDVDRLALRSTALNVAALGGPEPAGAVETHHASFFDLDPQEVGRFDAVVGNPPYVRQEDLSPDKDHFRAHLGAFGPPGRAPYRDGPKEVSAKSDAYVYFVTQAARFLRDGGRLGYVVPAKWMATDYGRSFQRFLFDQFRVEAVVGFDGRAFEGALVDTVLLLLERCEDPAERAGTVTRFVRLEGPTAVERILEAVRSDAPADDEGAATADGAVPDDGLAIDDGSVADDGLPTGGEEPATGEGPGPDDGSEAGEEEAATDDGGTAVETAPGRRTVARRQRAVAAAEGGKLAHLLSAPAGLVRLVEHPDLIRLGDVAEVAYGNKTGANDFFFLDGADLAEWPIDERFLAPAIKSLRDADARVVTAGTTDRYLLDVHDYVAAVEREGGSESGGGRPAGEDGAGGVALEERVERALARDGHDALLSYLAAGEREGYHERTTCAARRVWFDLGDLERPEVLHPKFFDDRIVPLWNRGRLAPSNAVDGIHLAGDVGELVLVGILNSTLHRAMLECWGRTEGGGALQLMTYEVETLPLVDPAAIEGERRERFEDATRRLLDGDAAARREIDRIVLDAVGVDLAVEELRTMRERTTDRRRRNGEAATAPVTGAGTVDGDRARPAPRDHDGDGGTGGADDG